MTVLSSTTAVASSAGNSMDDALQQAKRLSGLGRHEEALASVWTALGEGCQSSALWLEASAALFKLDRLAEARAVLRNALRLDPTCGRAWGALGEILSREGKEAAAESCFRRNAMLAPFDFLVRLRLAQWLTQDGRHDEANRYYLQSLALAPGSLDAVAGLAQLRISEGVLDEAEPLLRRVLARDPEHLDSSLGIARLQLLRGDFSAGWPAYEVRRRRKDFKVPKLAGPEWNGSPLAGKTLVVYPEQGFGDVIQFLRYTRLLYEEGARVIMLVPKELEALSQCLTLFAEVSSSLASLPAYDFHIPLLSLAMHLQADKAIPAQIPYLSVAPNPKQKLPVPFGTKLRVGLVWAGRPTHANNRHRSMTLEALLPLAAVPGVTLYALQAGPRAKDIHKEAHPVLIGDLSPHLKDFVDTARVIDQLDVVVAVDTSVAHLAGALGKPVWVLVPFAPDWRWLLGTEHTVWYPTMRLFRQTTPRRWDDVVERITGELAHLAAEREEKGAAIECVADSVFPKEDGTARYRLTTPLAYLSDAGVGYLFRHERSGAGYEYATRSFLDAHLEPGDLFIDVGAHWGIMSLHAATSKADIEVLACEPTPRNQPYLKRWIESNGLANKIEIIASAIAGKAGRGEMLPQSTMGHSLKHSAKGPISVTTIDQLLAERPKLAGRRVIVKIDVEGTEAEVVAGMSKLLGSGKVAAVIWERGRTHSEASVADLRATFTKAGFDAWRFTSEEQAGPLQPFANDGRIENIFELAPFMPAKPSYGGPRREKTAQPPDRPFDEVQQAHALFQEGLRHQAAGDTEKALSAYSLSGTLDRRSPDLLNNLGVAMQRLKRFPAAEAAYRRSLQLDPNQSGCLSNLGSVLREQGKVIEAASIQAQAAAKAPRNSGILSNAGHAHRDAGLLPEAQSYYEAVLELQPQNKEIDLERTHCLLKQGNYAEGFASYAAYSQKKGVTPKGKRLILEDDGSLEDALQFIRFAPLLARRAKAVELRCRPALIPLLRGFPGISKISDVSADSDFGLSLRALPALLKIGADDIEGKPYLSARADTVQGMPEGPELKIGLQWAAPARADISCPLTLLLPAVNDPDHRLLSLQQGAAAQDLANSGAVEFIQSPNWKMTDFADVAAILRGLDLLITIDGPLAHLAGALGVPTFLLLPFSAEWRWLDRRSDTPWYDSVRLFRQHHPGDWVSAVDDLAADLSSFADRLGRDHRRRRKPL